MNKNVKYLLLAAVIALVAIEGLGASVWATITGSSQNCEDTPYAENCFCTTGERKISVPWLGVQRWSCENIEQLLIDPESETFEHDSIEFVQQYLSTWCPSVYVDACQGAICGCPPEEPNCGAFAGSHPAFPQQACIAPAWGWGEQGARTVNVECLKINTWSTPEGEMTHEQAIAAYGEQYNEDISPKSGTAPWRMQFFVESETDTPTTLEVFVSDNYIYNEESNLKCTHQSVCDYYASQGIDTSWCVGNLPLTIVPNDYPMSIVRFLFSRRVGSDWRAPIP